jgi:hypothetical protein
MPVARGGEDENENRVTTSMLRNSAKANWLLEELGWELYPVGELKEWDGMINWFIKYVNNHPERLNTPYVYRWHKALIRAFENNKVMK